MKALTKELLNVAESIYRNAMDYEEDDMMDWELVEMWSFTLQGLFFKYKNETKDAPSVEQYAEYLKTSQGLMEHSVECEKQKQIKTPTNASKETPAEALADIIKALREVLGE